MYISVVISISASIKMSLSTTLLPKVSRGKHWNLERMTKRQTPQIVKTRDMLGTRALLLVARSYYIVTSAPLLVARASGIATRNKGYVYKHSCLNLQA